jgi:hypothetical protein
MMSHSRRRGMLAVLLGAACLAAAGCGRDVRLVPATGRVTLDGQPLARKVVRFVPEPGTPGAGSAQSKGLTDDEGRFALVTVWPGAVRGERGAPAGQYKVVIEEPVFIVEEGRPPLPPPPLPSELLSVTTTTVRAEVPLAGGSIDVEIPGPLRPFR